MDNSKSTVSKNILWRLAERIGAQGVSLIVEIILARLLEPEAYGSIALVLVITSILQVFVDSGLGNALIQKKDADELDFSSVFCFNLSMCSMLYLVMFVFAPIIASFYNNSDLVPIIRVLSLVLVISGLKNVQQAYVSRNMLFKKFFFSTLGGTLVAAVVGISMAYLGFGVWALVAQNLINKTIDTLVLWFTVDWKPSFKFSFTRLKGLVSYGWKLLASSLLENIYNNLRQLIIGKVYTTSDLAFYNKGKTFPNAIATNLNTSIDSVLFPAMANEQDNIKRVKQITRRSIKVAVYIIAPVMMGLAFCARSIVILLLKSKWLPCVPYLIIFCIDYMFWPVHTANLIALKAVGRSDIYLKLEIAKKISGLIAIFSTIFISVKAMALGVLIASLLDLIINTWPNRKLIHYGLFEQMKDIGPTIGLSIIMGLIVYQLQLLNFSAFTTLCLQIPAGVVIYITGSIVLRIDSFNFILGIVKPYIDTIIRKLLHSDNIYEKR